MKHSLKPVLDNPDAQADALPKKHRETLATEPLLEALEGLVGGAYFAVDPEHNVVAFSPEMARLTGLTREQVLGRHCLNAFRCPQCLQTCAVFERGRVGPVSLTLYHADGSPVRVRKVARTIRNEAGEAVLALERLELEVTPGEETAGLSGGVERQPASASMADGVFEALGRYAVAVDADFRIAGASERLASLFGQSHDTLLGMPLSDFVGPDLFEETSEFRLAVLRGERREGWRAMAHTLDGPSPVSVSAGRLDEDSDLALPCASSAVAVVVLRPESGQPSPDLGDEPTSFLGMVGRSQSMRAIFRLIDLLHGNDARVLITGESGTGKELVARAVHTRSHRARGPFIAVNCGALPGDLLESELFGHVRGAFTGALHDKAGRFEMADRGTLFLDEIGDLPLQLQVKLLRVIQEGTFERVGDPHPRQVDVRIVAATNRDLVRAVEDGTFREDLYYRLRVVPIEIPPLRVRREDLEPLVHHLLSKIGKRRGRSLRLSPSALRALLDYDWPGNVRQLENALEYATAICEGQTIHTGDLPGEVQHPAPRPQAPVSVTAPARVVPARGSLLATDQPQPVLAEADRIRKALMDTHFHRQRAADLLGMSRWTLWRKMKEFQITR